MSASSQQHTDSAFAGSSFPYSATTPPSPSASTVGGEDEDDSSDDYRDVWLRIWNNSSSPSEVSCRVAFDVLWYCYSPANQARTVYQTGKTNSCRRQREDIKLCGKIKLGRLTEQEARVSLHQLQLPSRIRRSCWLLPPCSLHPHLLLALCVDAARAASQPRSLRGEGAACVELED